MSTAYLNGKFIPLADAKISALDRGFLFGDGIYDVISVYNGVPLGMESHLKRLREDLEAINLPMAFTAVDWQNLIYDIVRQNKDGNQSIYIQVTRGAYSIRTHTYTSIAEPTVFIMSTPLSPYTLPTKGQKAITTQDPRGELSNIKTTSKLTQIMALQAAKEEGAVEVIFLRDGYAVECATSNLFIVTEYGIVTPPIGPYTVPGTTRENVIRLAATIDIPLRQKPITLDDLHNAREIWVTGATKGIVPITDLDGSPVNDGEIGPVWQTVASAYQECIRMLTRSYDSSTATC